MGWPSHVVGDQPLPRVGDRIHRSVREPERAVGRSSIRRIDRPHRPPRARPRRRRTSRSGRPRGLEHAAGVGLVPVVEGDRGRVGHERTLPRVLDPDAGAREHELVPRIWPSRAKFGWVGADLEPAHAHGAGVEEDTRRAGHRYLAPILTGSAPRRHRVVHVPGHSCEAWRNDVPGGAAADAGRLLRPRQPDERDPAERVHARAGPPLGTRDAPAAGDPLRLRALVRAGHRGDGHGRRRAPSTTSAASRASCTRCSTRRPASAALASRVQALARAARRWRATIDGASTTAPGRCSCHVFPEADVPVVQLSIDETQPPAFHYELGQRLAPAARRRRAGDGQRQPRPQPARLRVGPPVARALRLGAALRGARPRASCARASTARSSPTSRWARDAMLSVPTPDHYLPLAVRARAASSRAMPCRFPVEGFDGGSVSMLSVQIG